MTACARCGLSLDPVLPAAGFRTHPCCRPGEVSALWPPETAGDPGTLMRSGRWRLLVTCSRTWEDWDTAAAELGAALAARPDAVLVSGAAPHGDADLERIWARLLGTTREQAVAVGRIEQHPADWDAHPRAGGYRRNAAMVKLGADQCLAFVMSCALARCRTAGPHGTHGTADCVGLAHKAGIPVRRITPAIDNLDNRSVTV